jgi:hypothetical protein
LISRTLQLPSILVLALLAQSAPAWADWTPVSVRLTDRGYEAVKRKHGVVIYKHTTSEVVRLGAEGRIHAPPEDLFRAVLDFPGQVPLVKQLAESRILSRSGCQMTVYQRLDLPLVSDRDVTMRVTWGRTGQVYWMRYRAVTNLGPRPRRGVVRLPVYEGGWQIRPDRGGRASLVRLQTSIDLGGLVPRWLARSQAGDDMPLLFAAMRRLALQQRPPDPTSGQRKKLVACSSR